MSKLLTIFSGVAGIILSVVLIVFWNLATGLDEEYKMDFFAILWLTGIILLLVNSILLIKYGGDSR